MPDPAPLHRRLVPLLPMIVLALVAVVGCETSFEPFDSAGSPYNITGFLDAAAEVQFVRVDPLQDGLVPGEEDSVDARVTSQNLETGEVVEWRESVFYIGSTGVPVYNFWTTAPIEPGATYRFTAERQSDGATATAEVTLPDAFPHPRVMSRPVLGEEGEGAAPAVLRVEGVEQIGGVRAEYDYESCIPTPRGLQCGRRRSAASYLADTTRTGPEAWRIEVPWYDDIPRTSGAYVTAFYSFRVSVASVSEDWPEGRGPVFVPGTPSPPQLPGGGESNVENGTGFLGGAFVRTIDVPVAE